MQRPSDSTLRHPFCTFHFPVPVSPFLNLCAFASLADVAKGGDGVESALREIFLGFFLRRPKTPRADIPFPALTLVPDPAAAGLVGVTLLSHASGGMSALD